jgi:hypothetical protein
MAKRAKGEMPIPYIVALLLGVVVIALIAYFLFFNSNLFWNMMLERTCEAKKTAYCSEWNLKGKPPTPKFSDNCDLTVAKPSDYTAPECCQSTAFNKPFNTQTSC